MLELEIQSPKPETRVPNPKTKIVGIVVCCVDHISVLLVCRPTSSYEVCQFGAKNILERDKTNAVFAFAREFCV